MVSVVVILVATATLYWCRPIRNEKMNNFKVRRGRGWSQKELRARRGWKWGVAIGTFGLCAQCGPPELMEGCASCAGWGEVSCNEGAWSHARPDNC